MAEAMTRRVYATLQLINDKYNDITNNAVFRFVFTFRRTYPRMFLLFSPILIPFASFLVFFFSVILFGALFLLFFYGILFLMLVPTMIITLSGPVMFSFTITCTCYSFYHAFLMVQKCLHVIIRRREIARQLFNNALGRVIWFFGMENGSPFTNQDWLNLRSGLSRRYDILRNIVTGFSPARTVEHLIQKNFCQRARTRIEQLRTMYFQVIELHDSVLAISQQVGGFFNRMLSIIHVFIQFILKYPRRMIDRIMWTYRKAVSFFIFLHHLYRSIRARVIRIFKFVMFIVNTLHQTYCYIISIPTSFFSEKSLIERLEEKVEEIKDEIDRITRLFEERRQRDITNNFYTRYPSPPLRHCRATSTHAVPSEIAFSFELTQ